MGILGAYEEGYVRTVCDLVGRRKEREVGGRHVGSCFVFVCCLQIGTKGEVKRR